MKSILAKIYIVLVFSVFIASNLFGATYYSQGSVTPSTTTNWNTVRAGGGSSPANFSTANDIFVIQNGHNMTTSTTWTISGSNSKLQIESGGTLTANHAVTVAATSTFQIDNGGTYIHNNTGAGSSTIFAGTESFSSNSLFEIRNYQNGVALPASLAFGNLTINLINYTGGTLNQTGNLATVNGNLSIASTGATTQELRLIANSPTSSTLTIGGDLNISGGILTFSSGSATMVINVGGNINQTGGTIQHTGSASPGTTINFTGGSSSNVGLTLNGTYLNNDKIDWTIAAGKKVANNTNFGSGSLVGTGRTITINGTFQVNEGSWTGSSGTWNYASGSSLIFNNSSGPYGPIDGNHVYWPSTNGPTNVTVQNGGGIIMGVSRTVGGTFTLVTGTNAVQGTSLRLNGTVLINGGNFQSSPIYGTNSTLTYNTGGIYGRNNEWSANGVGTIGSTPGYPNNVVVSNNTTLNLPNGDNTARATNRDLTIDAGSSLYADYGGGSVLLTVGRSFSMAGNLSLGASIGGDMVVKTHWTKTGGTFNPNNRAVFFNNASGAQTITGATTFDYLVVDKSSSSLSLNNDITINQTLTLSNGTITTNSNKVIIASTGSVSRTNGWINGNLEQFINTGATSKTFDIGSSNEYTPCSVAFGNVSSGGYLLGYATGSLLAPASGNVPTGSGISQTKYVSRGWTLNNSGISFNNYSATFNFQPGDIVGGGNPNVFIVGKNSGGTWSNPTIGTRTATSTQITGATSFSDFRIGEFDCTTPSSLVYTTNNMNLCLNVAASSNNVSSVAGSTPISYTIMPALPTGLSINPTTGAISGTPMVSSPTTSYTITATNACGNTTANVTITVNALPTATASNDGPKCVGGTLTLSSSGGNTYAWSGPNMYAAATQNPMITSITAATGGTYTVTVTDANGCTDTETTTATINALPTGVVSGGGTVCPGSTLPDVIFTFTGTPPFSFTYFDGTSSVMANAPSTTYTLTAAPLGTYTLTALADANCSATMAQLSGSATNAYNAVPTLNTPAVIARCSGVAWGVNLPSAASGVVNAYRAESRTYNPGTMTFSSQIPNFFPAPGLGTPITVPEVWYNTSANPGTVTYSISATTDGVCYGPAVNMTVTINPLPTAAISVAETSGTTNNDGTICNGASATLTASGGTGYQWDNMTSNAMRTVNPATTTAYFVTVTDGNGCTDTETTTITVNNLPMVNAGSYAAQCVSATTLALAGSPMGGTFSGPGVSGSNFNASVAGTGSKTITYTYTDGNGCANSATASIIVNALPIVNAGTYPDQCVSATTLALAGSPMGGTFSGPGVSGSNFNASVAGTGSKTITYTYTDGNGCTNSATTNIMVNPLPSISAGSYTGQCVSSTTLNLFGFPSGGVFSGPGVSGTNFNASVAGVGEHTITYNYTDFNGCSNTTTSNITVYALPVVNAGSYAAQCVSATTLALAGSPMGGTFSGPGVSGSNFNASVAGVGMHTITYNYTDGSGCSNSATTSITVNGLPMVSAGSYAAQCVSATMLSLTGSPMGGSFSGPGVSGNNFNASVAGTGSKTITYTYTDGNGCTNSATTSITVNAQPTAAISSSSGCGGANTTLMASGGTMYSWSTMENTQTIIVSTSGTFTVTVTDGNGCTDTESIVVNPATPPIYNQSTMTCYSDIAMAINNLMPGENLIINIGSYSGEIKIPVGSTLTISPNTSVTATGNSCILGSIVVDPMGSFTNNGTMLGTGNVNGKLNNNGTLSPGTCSF